MQFKFSSEPLERIKADMAVLLCPQRKKDKNDKGEAILQKSDGGTALDKYLGGLISRTITAEGFRGEAGSHKLIHSEGRIPARAILLVGIGEAKDFTPDISRRAAAKIVSVANEIKAASAAGTVQPEKFKGFSPAERLQAFAEGAILGSYKFKRYKNKKETEEETLKEITFSLKSGRKEIQKAAEAGLLIAEAVNFARDLINMPANDMTPGRLAEKAGEIAQKERLGAAIFDKKRIEKEKMNLLLAVAAGSKNEPRFIHLSYKPVKKAKMRIALIGKGVTFDTGGYNLKPGASMDHMKDDMGGAAVSLAVMKIISRLRPPVAVDMYIPATDNMIGGRAETPGNVITSLSGKTVEIVNTDAEGRLILADAVTYALKVKPDIIIDVATLTGHVRYALGEIYTAVLGNDQRLIDKYLAAAKAESEAAWQMPLEKFYKKGLKEGIADINNNGRSKAGTIMGALFLEEFVGETKWLHLDIAESSWADEDRDYTPKGGTGAPVRSLAKFILSIK